MTGLRLLFRITLRRRDLADEIYHIKEPSCRRRALPVRQIPLVMSADEIKRQLTMAHNIKIRVMPSLSYGCGLRAGEVVKLRAGHIVLEARLGHDGGAAYRRRGHSRGPARFHSV